jgi:hypothetical protein
MVASVAFLKAAGSGYGIGLNDHGDRIEFIGDWRSLVDLRTAIASTGQPQAADVEVWQVLAVNGELKLPLSEAAMDERASFVTAAIHQLGSPKPS